MQTAGQKRVRAGPTPEEEDFQQHRVLQSWFRLMRRFLLALMPLQQMLERFMDHMLSTKPHREALKEMIRSLPDEDLPMIQNVARQEMNRREDTGHRPQADGYWSNLSETSTHPARRPRPPPDPVLTERCRQINSLPGIEMILEPRPRCQCALQCKIHLSDSGPTGHNYKKLYFRCPLEQGHQCRFVKWCDQQPLLSLESWRHRQQPGDEPVSYAQILEAMIQTKCQHKETHRKGSNAFLTKVTCRICNKVIKVREDRKDGGDQVQGQHDILKLGTTLSSGNPLTSDSSDHLGRHRPGAPDRLSGISRISPLEEPTSASEPGGPMKQVTPKLERKLRAAIKKATAFWRELQLLLADMPLQCWAQALYDEICQEFTMNPAGAKRSREIAEVMGLTVKQLKTVAEVYNPGCFQKITGRFHLSPGRAFDLILGDDLLSTNKQNEVWQYVQTTKPGLVCIAPPCKMYTQLQNLSKEKRARLPDLMKRYLKNKAEGDRLLTFAIRLCES